MEDNNNNNNNNSNINYNNNNNSKNEIINNNIESNELSNSNNSNKSYKYKNQEIRVNNSQDSFKSPALNNSKDAFTSSNNEQNNVNNIHDGPHLNHSLFVTARNLSSTVGKGEKEKKILTDLNFFIKPGSMVLLLGSPGCGKTSLMNTLALLTNNETISGNLLFNGKHGDRKTHHRHVGYVIQEDQHMAALTVKETLKFSANCQIGEKTEQERNEKVEEILEFLELKHVQDTVVGDEFLRGISGGQKKRVTIGVELVKDSNLLLMDEPTNGLDSSIALDLMQKIRSKVDKEKLSCFVSLLQPGVEITRLFDYLMIMNQGQMSYFGPMNQAIGYFESLGFKFPHHHNPAEFFQEIVDEPELYWGSQDTVPLYKGAEDFASAFRKSDIYKYTLEYIDSNIPDPNNYIDYSTLGSYSISFAQQLRLNIKRGMQLHIGNLVSLRLRILKNVVMGFILGTLYWKLEANQTDGNNRSSLLFFSLLTFVFGGFSSISIFFIQRPIFYQQRAWKYYNTFSYFVAMTINDIPISIMEVLIFSNLLYWMAGLHKTWDRFIYFLIMCFLNDVMSQAMLRMVSAFSPNKNIAAALGPALISPFLLMCGFMKKHVDIPGWWIWLYWISPIHYGFEGLLINEQHGLEYHCDPNELYPPRFLPNFNLSYPLGFEGQQVCPIKEGDQILESIGFHSEFYYRWIDLAIVGGFTLTFLGLTYVFMKKIKFYEYRKDVGIKVKGQKATKEMRVDIKSSQAKLKKGNIPNGCYMQWKDLVYEVDGKKDGKKQRLRLLNEINGYVKPGMLLALMGPSGAGKSTLLDVLANRKTGGYINGEILINGKPRDKYFTRISAYVEQMDILSPTQTVREAIMFSAQTRLSKNVALKDKIDFVDNILETLNLTKIQNSLIGEGESGLSLAQRKRVNMGIELASDPQLLFLDEPTSGLDSSSALKVMNFIKKIASSGRAVICTIHQPSTTIFKKFDHLLLLKKGGETVYFGPTGENSSVVLDYFSKHGLECDSFKNPADFILDVTDDGIQVVNEKGESVPFNPVHTFKESDNNKQLVEKVHTSIMPQDTPQPSFHGKYSSTVITQFKELNKRAWLGSIRRVQIIRSRIGRSLVLAIVIGTLFLRMEKGQEDVYNRVSLLFFSLMFGGMAGMSVIPVVVTERAVFYREQASGMYRVWLYYLNFVISDLPWVILSSYAYVIPVYFLSGLTLEDGGWPFFYHSFVSVFVYLNFSLAAIFLASVLPSEEIAFVFNGVLLSLTSLFAGFMVPPKSLPKYWKWVYDIDFITYPLKAYLTTEFKDLEFDCPDNKGAVPIPIPSKNNTVNFKLFCPITKGTQVLDQVDYYVKDQYYDILITAAFTVFFLVLGYLSFRFVRYQNK